MNISFNKIKRSCCVATLCLLTTSPLFAFGENYLFSNFIDNIPEERRSTLNLENRIKESPYIFGTENYSIFKQEVIHYFVQEGKHSVAEKYIEKTLNSIKRSGLSSDKKNILYSDIFEIYYVQNKNLQLRSAIDNLYRENKENSFLDTNVLYENFTKSINRVSKEKDYQFCVENIWYFLQTAKSQELPPEKILSLEKDLFSYSSKSFMKNPKFNLNSKVLSTNMQKFDCSVDFKFSDVYFRIIDLINSLEKKLEEDEEFNNEKDIFITFCEEFKKDKINEHRTTLEQKEEYRIKQLRIIEISKYQLDNSSELLYLKSSFGYWDYYDVYCVLPDAPREMLFYFFNGEKKHLADPKSPPFVKNSFKDEYSNRVNYDIYDSPTVYVTMYGERFHRLNCRYLIGKSVSRTKIHLTDCTPCSICY